MRVAYVDTSCLVAIAFAESGSATLARSLRSFDTLLASNLLEAELRASLLREKVEKGAEKLLSWVTWLLPNRELTPEFTRVLRFGYVRGGDLWHLACALFAAKEPERIYFLTLDERQRQIAQALGFQQL